MALADWLAQTRTGLSTFRSEASTVLRFLWNVYSKPTPSNRFKIFILFLLCFFISTSIAALLLLWMVYSLTYDLSGVAIFSGVFTVLVTAVLMMVHPVRCVLSILLPSLGTGQGRKILISSVLTLTLATCVPNMVRNANWTAYLIRCSSRSLITGMLNSSQMTQRALGDINAWAAKMPASSGMSSLSLKQEVDASAVRREISAMADNMKADLTSVHDSLSLASSVLQKLTAAALVLLMLCGSAVYLIGYLTDLKYDNVYASRRLMAALVTSGGDGATTTLPVRYRGRLVRTAGVKMTRDEVRRCAWGVMVLGFYAMLCFAVIALDHFVYRALELLLAWTRDVPEIKFQIDVNLEVGGQAIGFIDFPIERFHNSYSHRLDVLPGHCVKPLSPPDSSIITSACVLLLTGLLLVLGQVFARRLRRKICASFYNEREEERTHHLLQKILDEREREKEDN